MTNSKGQTLYEAVKEAGIPIGNHYSDLYAKSCRELDEILKEFPLYKTGALRQNFTSCIDKTRWSSFPFLFDPYWSGDRVNA